MLDTKVVIFITVSIGLIWISRGSLRHPRSHGFPRFFAWEAILLLILRSTDFWLREPSDFSRIISWILLTLSAGLAVHSLILFRKLGKLSRERQDPALMGIEKTTALVTSGIYRFIRHPMYCSLILLAWGIFFIRLSAVSGVLATVASLFLFLTALREEAENISYFGEEYREYMNRSKMFFPFFL